MELLSERVKVDIGLVGQTLSVSNVTGKYHSMAGWERALAILICGALAATKTCKLEIFEALNNSDGGSAALIAGASQPRLTANNECF